MKSDIISWRSSLSRGKKWKKCGSFGSNRLRYCRGQIWRGERIDAQREALQRTMQSATLFDMKEKIWLDGTCRQSSKTWSTTIGWNVQVYDSVLALCKRDWRPFTTLIQRLLGQLIDSAFALACRSSEDKSGDGQLHRDQTVESTMGIGASGLVEMECLLAHAGNNGCWK